MHAKYNATIRFFMKMYESKTSWIGNTSRIKESRQGLEYDHPVGPQNKETRKRGLSVWMLLQEPWG